MKKKNKVGHKGETMSGNDSVWSKLHKKIKRYDTHRIKKIYSQITAR